MQSPWQRAKKAFIEVLRPDTIPSHITSDPLFQHFRNLSGKSEKTEAARWMIFDWEHQWDQTHEDVAPFLERMTNRFGALTGWVAKQKMSGPITAAEYDLIRKKIQENEAAGNVELYDRLTNDRDLYVAEHMQTFLTTAETPIPEALREYVKLLRGTPPEGESRPGESKG